VHCHHPRNSTVDHLPLSIGTGGSGIGVNRQQLEASFTRRNAQALFNIGLSHETPMFWDGRVSFSEKSHSFITPEPALNGYFVLHPDRIHPIARALDSSLAAQALFPLVNAEEMRGKPGSNEIADAPDNLEAWNRIIRRFVEKPHYKQLFEDAYPGTRFEEINIGHVGTAIAAFERQAFTANQTPLDRYLRGDETALTTRQKRGAALFVGRGRCVECHSGAELTSYGFFTTAVPQLQPVLSDGTTQDDLGRMEVETDHWLREKWRYSFRTPALRNVRLTAPYMHDGSMATLREVVIHYSDPGKSVERPRAAPASPMFRDKLRSDAGTARAKARLWHLDERLREPIALNWNEVDALVDFLENALTDPVYVEP